VIVISKTLGNGSTGYWYETAEGGGLWLNDADLASWFAHPLIAEHYVRRWWPDDPDVMVESHYSLTPNARQDA